MFTYLPHETQDELALLAERYGQPLVHIADLGKTTHFDPLNRHDRYGEVCMVIRRPNGHLLTMKKVFYPSDAYRLLTGGINHGEHVFDALLRETHEETSLTTNTERFLAAAAYRTADGGDEPLFYTFAFLLNEVGGALGVLDEDEHVEAFREIAPRELPTIAAHLAHLQAPYSRAISGNWSDWGKFRAVIHSLVWQALASPD
jgi:ADP-ribose pyrophosphatase YjhB (NUDIX family)